MGPCHDNARHATPALRQRTRCVRALFSMVALLGTAFAQAAVLELDATEPRRGLAPYVRYTFSDTIAVSPADAEFKPLDQRYIDFGYRPKTIWLALDIHNASDRPGRWKLSLNVRFMTELTVYLRGADGERVLMRQDTNSTFASRPIPYRNLAADFSLAAHEQAQILIGYRSTGTSALPISIETDASFVSRYSREDIVNAACYAAILFMIVFGLLQFVVLRQQVQLHYALYLGAALCYIAHMDGHTFEWLWPNSPRWNSYAAVPLGLAMSVAALNFSRSFIGVRGLSIALDRAFLALMALAILAAGGIVFFSEGRIKGIAYWITVSAAGMCLLAGLLAYRKNQPAVRFYIIGWAGVFAGVSITTVANNFPALIPKTGSVFVPKLTILFDALMFSMAMADRARALRRERDSATQRELAALRLQQETAEQLHSAERERLKAQLLAQEKTDQLATASHDIRQPLTSLKLTLSRLAQSGELAPPVIERFTQSLDYLDKLAREYTAIDEQPQDSRPASRTFSVAMLLDNIELMFREEAESKGLAFRCRIRDAQAEGDAMAAMRIVSNLVANAIKYTPRGKVLLASAIRADEIRIAIGDTGPGIPQDEQARVLQSRQRGSNAGDVDGSGLGLNIAVSLADQHGFGFAMRSTPGRGTLFTVTLPRPAT